MYIAKKINIIPVIGLKNSTFKIYETLDEKYAVSEKITKAWIPKIEHKIIYWYDSTILELNKKFGKKNQKNSPTLGFEIFIIIPCLYKFFELFIFFFIWFLWKKR